jgi:hypothetical protein
MPDDIAWLLENALGEVVVLRADGVAKHRSRKERPSPKDTTAADSAAGSNTGALRKCSIESRD